MSKISYTNFPQVDYIYQYDGSFEGFLSCVFTSFFRKECPVNIQPINTTAVSLFPILPIATNTAHAKRVYNSLAIKISPDAQYLVRHCFLSGASDKEYLLLQFLYFSFTKGNRALSMLGHHDIAPVFALQKNVLREAHHYKGFLRFEEHDNMLGAVISPKNYVLPLLRGHFCTRFPEENFLIYDETHQEALLYQNHKAEFLTLTAPLSLPKANDKESYYKSLWKRFYDTIAIAERENPTCRRTHCPKRYWAHMSEMPDS